MEIGLKQEFTWYVPNFPQENRTVPPAEAIQVEILPMDNIDGTEWGVKLNSVLNQKVGGQRAASNTGAQDARKVNAISKKTFKVHVRGIKNCTVLGVDMKTAEDLQNNRGVPSELILDITRAINSYEVFKEGLVEEVKKAQSETDEAEKDLGLSSETKIESIRCK